MFQHSLTPLFATPNPQYHVKEHQHIAQYRHVRCAIRRVDCNISSPRNKFPCKWRGSDFHRGGTEYKQDNPAKQSSVFRRHSFLQPPSEPSNNSEDNRAHDLHGTDLAHKMILPCWVSVVICCP